MVVGCYVCVFACSTCVDVGSWLIQCVVVGLVGRLYLFCVVGCWYIDFVIFVFGC